jgi:hypothetical protein
MNHGDLNRETGRQGVFPSVKAPRLPVSLLEIPLLPTTTVRDAEWAVVSGGVP